MYRTYISSVIDAPIAKVWNTIRSFDSLSVWHPYVATCPIEGGLPTDKLGVVRRIVLREGGGIVREALLELSDIHHRIVYNIVESPMPVQNYVSRIELHEITEGAKTYAYWNVEFDTAEKTRDKMIATLQDIYRKGFLKLNELVK